MTNAAVATIGHNNPPSDIEALTERLTTTHAPYFTMAQELADKAAKLKTPTNEDEAEQVTELIRDISNLARDTDTLFDKEKAPWWNAGKAVDAFFNPLKNQLKKAKDAANAQTKAYLIQKRDAERERLAAEQDRLRKESEAQAAAAAKLETVNKAVAEGVFESAVKTEAQADRMQAMTQQSTASVAAVRTSTGGMSSLATVMKGTLTDIATLDLEKLRFLISPDAYQTAINKYVREGGTELKGAIIREEVSARTR